LDLIFDLGGAGSSCPLPNVIPTLFAIPNSLPIHCHPELRVRNPGGKALAAEIPQVELGMTKEPASSREGLRLTAFPTVHLLNRFCKAVGRLYVLKPQTPLKDHLIALTYAIFPENLEVPKSSVILAETYQQNIK
jgi:hypothetical protein